MTAERRCNFGLCDKKAKRRGNEGPEAGEAAVGKVCRLPRKEAPASDVPGIPAGVLTRGGKGLSSPVVVALRQYLFRHLSAKRCTMGSAVVVEMGL